MQLMTVTLQNMFPKINVQTVPFISLLSHSLPTFGFFLLVPFVSPPLDYFSQVRLSECRRVVLMNYDRNTKRIELRHYLIQMTPVGLSKSVKRLLTASKVPDFSRYTDIADYVLG